MSAAVGVVAAIFVILLSVMLHEAGHFLTAKKFGMKATRFFVGFGPTLWSTQRGETEYGVKAIPAGGFVKILGMTPLEQLEPEDQPRAFWRFPAPQRVVVLLAGSAVHMVLAILMVYGVLVTVGDISNPQPSRTVGQVSTCTPRTATAGLACTAADPRSPALGRLRPGDRIVSVDGAPVSTWDQLVARIRASAGHPLTLGFERAGREQTTTLTPVAVERQLTQGGKPVTVGAIGVVPGTQIPHYGAVSAVPHTFGMLGTFATSTWHVLGRIPHDIPGLIEGKPRDVNGPASIVDIARVSGDIAAAKVTVGERIAEFLLIMASLNFFIGLFNALPLLPLDGGHVAILVFEQARSGLYRLMGRRDPGRVDLNKVLPFAYAVVAVFVGLSLLLLYAGIFNPIRIQ